MEYNKIVAVTGLPGLFELVSTKADGGIVRSLDGQKAQFVSSRIHQFTNLESIEIFTVRENVNLVEVFEAMGNTSDALPDEKNAAAVKAYFEKVYPDMDFDRVYNSDMKKIIKWFTILKAANVELKLTEVSEEEAEATAEIEASVKEEKPVKPARSEATKTKAKKEAKPTETEEPVAKKPAAKKTIKKTEEETPKKSARSASAKTAPKKK